MHTISYHHDKQYQVNKKKNAKVQNRVSNKLSDDNQAAEKAYKNDLDRISVAIMVS